MQTTIEGQFQSPENLDKCIQSCLACYEECTKCVSHCLAQGGAHAEQKHILLMLECAEMCSSSSSLMLLKGQFSIEHCQLCAQVCDACEASCRGIDADDEMMQKCADTCSECAEACRSMAS